MGKKYKNNIPLAARIANDEDKLFKAMKLAENNGQIQAQHFLNQLWIDMLCYALDKKCNMTIPQIAEIVTELSEDINDFWKIFQEDSDDLEYSFTTIDRMIKPLFERDNVAFLKWEERYSDYLTDIGGLAHGKGN